MFRIRSSHRFPKHFDGQFNSTLCFPSDLKPKSVCPSSLLPIQPPPPLMGTEKLLLLPSLNPLICSLTPSRMEGDVSLLRSSKRRYGANLRHFGGWRVGVPGSLLPNCPHLHPSVHSSSSSSWCQKGSFEFAKYSELIQNLLYSTVQHLA